MGGRIFRTIAPIAGSILGNMLLPGIGSALGSGLGSLASGSSPLQALGNAAGSYFGGNLLGSAGNVGPGGTVASGLGGFGSLGSSVANMLPAELAGSSLSGIAGSYLGSNIGESVGTALGGTPRQQSAPESPTAKSRRTDAGFLPSQFSGLSPDQQSTGLATQGVYGGGNGPDENQYFLNLINSRLSDSHNMGSLQPIESGYLSQLGLGGTQDPDELLRRIGQYQYA